MGELKPSSKRVVIVDDSRTMQAALENILTARLGYEIVGTAGDSGSALQMIRRLRPDLVTIDLSLPYIDGQQLLKELEAFSEMHKVVISATACGNPALKTSLERAGAHGVISKKDITGDPDNFCRALSSVMRRTDKPAGKAATTVIAREASIASYPVPDDERERLAALAAYGVANDHAEDRLDLLTEHLAKTTSFSACVMTFVDSHTVWVKSGHGFERGAVARSQAICSHTICADEPFIVHDTLADRRFDKLEAVVSGPMIRSYVGYPIVGSSGVRLGAICLLDTKPRRATVKELSNLRSIARIAAELVEKSPVQDKQAA